MLIIKELLEILAKSLVDKPDEVVVTQVDSDDVVTLSLRVAQGDVGKVIGKQGRIAKSIRNLVKAAAVHQNKRVVIEIA